MTADTQETFESPCQGGIMSTHQMSFNHTNWIIQNHLSFIVEIGTVVHFTDLYNIAHKTHNGQGKSKYNLTCSEPDIAMVVTLLSILIHI